jgi:hypothetical protein
MSTPTPPEPESSAGPKESERRAVPRTACKVQVYCRPGAAQTSGPWWQATVLDVSTRGVRLLLTRKVEAGTPLTITLPGAPVEGRRRVLGARIVRVFETDTGWAAGCLLLGRKLSEDEIRVLAGETPTA